MCHEQMALEKPMLTYLHMYEERCGRSRLCNCKAHLDNAPWIDRRYWKKTAAVATGTATSTRVNIPLSCCKVFTLSADCAPICFCIDRYFQTLCFAESTQAVFRPKDLQKLGPACKGTPLCCNAGNSGNFPLRQEVGRRS